MFWQSKKFRTRLTVTIGIILMIGLGALSPNAIVLRATYLIAAAIAVYEIAATTTISGQVQDSVTSDDMLGWLLLPLLLIIILFISIIGFSCFELKTILLLLFVSYGSDVIGYLVGNFIGCKFIKACPFPRSSPTKTWEGTIASALLPIPIVIITNCLWPSSNPTNAFIDCALELGSLVSILGDYTASRFKRAYSIKDSCDYVAQNRVLRYFEALLGGNNGHGGYLDRTDSLSFVTAYAAIIYAVAPKIG